MYSAGQKRDVSDIRRRREEAIAELDAKHGIGRKLREMDEDTVKAARPPQGHRYWGLTIFRCTYKDDEAWSQFIKLIRQNVKNSAERHGASDLIESFYPKVFEDPAVFEGASTTLLRQKFLAWRSGSASEEKTDGVDGHPIVLEDNIGRFHGTRPRYRFLVQVDEDSLNSIIDRETKTPRDYSKGRGHVNLIYADWELPDPKESVEEQDVDSEVEDPLDEDEEPIEGCKLFDVGWMKTHITVFGVAAQPYLDDEGWRINYVRPPGVVENF